MKIQPLEDRVLLRPIDGDFKSDSGKIHLLNETKKQIRATVLAVGPGRKLTSGKLLPMQTLPGDEVIFGKNSGSIISFNGEPLVLMPEGDIMAVVG